MSISRSRACLIVGGLLLLAAGVSARMLLGARAELVLARDSGHAEARLRHLRRAMAYYLPGNPWVRSAHEALRATAREAEVRGDRALALAAWRELRSAVLALRGSTRPYAESLPEANARIAVLSFPAGNGEARQALEQRLSRPPEPNPGWAALALFGLLVWLAGAAVLLAAGLRPDARPRPGRFVRLLVPVAAGWLLFALGLGYA